jgi:myo-inositol-1(or 4)-monophosphatase
MTWKLVAVAAEAVLRAGRIQKQRYETELTVEFKGVIDLVTEVDRECETAILDTIRSHFPDHDVLAEESGRRDRGSRYSWHVDPLDGTTNFAHGYPCFCSSVGVAFDGTPVAGAVYDPLRDELFTAEQGAGAYANGRRLRVSSRATLLESLLITGFPYDLREDVEGKLRNFNRMMARARAIRRDGSAALDLCYVAAGRAEGFFEERLAPWDMTAGRVMVSEAGGRSTRYDGTAIGNGADEIIASNGIIHAALIEALSE